MTQKFKETYTQQEVEKATLEYFNGDTLPTDVWMKKYCLKDENNYYELTPDDMHRRLAKKFNEIEKTYSNEISDNLSEYGKKRSSLETEKIFNYFKNFKYISPQGSIMTMLGNNNMIGSLSNCVVVPKIHDSYGGIMYSDQQLAQLFKRRCVSEHSYVKEKNKGLIKIKDIQIGDYVLSKNIENNVDKYEKVLDKFDTVVDANNRVEIMLSNGTILHSSKLHPILIFNENGYEYVNIENLKIGDVVVKPKLNGKFFDISDDDSVNDISWFIGHHLGDGNTGLCKCKTTKNYGRGEYVYERYRFRLLSNSKECVDNYAKIHKLLSNSNINVRLSTRKHYKSDVWEYHSTIKKNKEIIENYLDSQSGNKTYSSFVPNYIKNNNTWIPFISGLIDADGYIKDGGTIEISLSNKSLIDEISSYISSIGLFYKISTYNNKRINEKRTYRILIHYDKTFFNLISKYIIHPDKLRKLIEYKNKTHSKKIFISEIERNDILYNYYKVKNRGNNISAIISLLKKEKILALSGYESLYCDSIISKEKLDEIRQRIYVTEVNIDVNTENYMDIEVENNNNFYSGNFGLINIHNCGAGIDISTLRPANTSVTNAAGTSTGAISFMERFSNTTREVGQCLYESTQILTENGIKKIRDVNIGDYVWTENEWVKVINVIKNKKKTFKIITKFGNEIIASKDHVFSTIDGEKRLSDFNVGDEINMIWGKGNENNEYVSLLKPNLEGSGNRLIKHKLPEILNEDLGYILGYMYGDGSFDKKISKTTGNHIGTGISLACALDRPEIIKKLKTLWEKIFGSELNTKECDGEWLVLGKSSQQIYKFLEENGIRKEKAGNLIFPEKIMNSPISVQLAFIGGYFDADGYASVKKKGYAFNSIDKEFLLKIKYILSSLNILTKLHVEDRSIKKWQDLYSLCVVGANSKIKLKQVLNESLKLEKATLSANRDCFLSIYKNNKLTNIKSHHKYSYIPDNTQYLSINVLRRLNEDDVETKISNPVLYQDFIEDISEFENESNVYDLVLVDTHLFWANGFYAHNSGRRGALMTSIDVRHPDIFEFVKIKRDLKKVTGSNISVMLRDDFMEAVENNGKYVLRFPVESDIENAQVTREINAIDLWNEIIISAHMSAEPGLIFMDRQHQYSTSSIYPNWKNISTNPCSEIAMNDDSCRLMIVNYFGCVENPFTDNARFNFEKLYEISYEGQRLIDDLVDLELLAVEKILDKIKSDPEPDYVKSVELKTWENLRDKGKEGRRTGLGFTGIGDVFAALGMKYDSDDAMTLLNKISETKFLGEFDSSIDMAIQRGKFNDFNPEHENKSEFVQMIRTEYPELYKRMMKNGRRNISISTVAPTGSLSILTQTTSGIEPLFMIGYTRRKKLNPNEKNIKIDFIDDMGDAWTEFDVLHPRLKQWKEINNVDDASINNPYIGSTASEIDWIKRIKIQSIVQKYVTHSISSTINLPSNVNTDKVSEIYLEAWKNKLKGITIYRDGSRSGVLISNKEKKEIPDEVHASKRPKRLKGEIHRFQNNLEKWIAVVGIKDGRPYEIFTGKLENGLANLPSNLKECEVVKNIIEIEEIDIDGTVKIVKRKRYDIEYVDNQGEKHIHTGLSHAFNPEYWNYAKFISGVLRHRMPLVYIYDLIDSLTFSEDHINTWKNGVGRVIKRYIKDGEKGVGVCNSCGSENLEYREGCLICMGCGHSACS